MRVHILKTWPGPFRAVVAGEKTYEIRKDDRGFCVGDFLLLREWEPKGTGRIDESASFRKWYSLSVAGETRREQWVRVTYKTPGGSWGLPSDVCVMAVERCEEPSTPKKGVADA